jgi:hypothetical protein
MRLDPTPRELALRDALRADLAQLDPPLLAAMGRALERNDDRLIGGAWGVDDGEGCLLTLAAGELGYTSGEELLATSVSAVRVPAQFDELWVLILERTGDAATARSITRRLVAEALALGQAAAEPVAERSALPR